MILRSAAKVNLTLDILGRRADGYHLLRSIVHTIGLWDELRFSFGVPWGLKCNVRELESDDNLCLRAARLYLEKTGRAIDDHPLHISLHKTIPASAGLGGGSGNAAAALRAMQVHFGDDVDLNELATKLGADVPLFLRGGAILMEGVGEIISPLAPLDFWLVIAKPAEFGRTSQVFSAWDKAPVSSNATDAMLRALEHNDARSIADALRNDLRDAAETCGVRARELETMLRECGALGASMSGSGSAVFGIYDNEIAARRGAAQLSKVAPSRHFELEIFVARFCDCGIEIAAPDVV